MATLFLKIGEHMKDVFKYIKANDKDYPFVFNINVYQEIIKKYGKKNGLKIFMELIDPIETMIDENGNEVNVKVIDEEGKEVDKKGEPDMETFLWFFKECVNEGIDMENDSESEHYIKREIPRPFIRTEKQIGRIVSALPKAQDELMQLFSESVDSGIEKNE